MDSKAVIEQFKNDTQIQRASKVLTILIVRSISKLENFCIVMNFLLQDINIIEMNYI